jgi:hypothetical protein
MPEEDGEDDGDPGAQVLGARLRGLNWDRWYEHEHIV